VSTAMFTATNLPEWSIGMAQPARSIAATAGVDWNCGKRPAVAAMLRAG